MNGRLRVTRIATIAVVAILVVVVVLIVLGQVTVGGGWPELRVALGSRCAPRWEGDRL